MTRLPCDDTRDSMSFLFQDDRNQGKSTVIAFDHIRKCAGTAVAMAFYDAGFPCFRIYTATAQLDMAEELNARVPGGPILLFGHYVYGIHEHLSSRYNVHYFTFVRPPRDIARSFFRYQTLRCRHLRGTFADFLADHDCNIMTDHLGGRLDLAIERLDGYFFVGYADDFHHSIKALGRLLDLPLETGHVINKSARPGTAKRDALPETFFPAGDDFPLYDHCRRRFPLPAATDQEPTPPATLPQSAYYDAIQDHIQAARQCDAATVRERLETEPFDRDLVLVASGQLKLPIPYRHFLELLRLDADEAIIFLDPAAIDTKERYAPLLAIAQRLVARSIPGSQSWVTRQAQQMLWYLATTAHAVAQGASRELIEAAHRLGRQDQVALMRRACWLRINGRAEDALSLLETTDGGCHPRLRAREYLTTLQAARGEEALRAFVRDNRERLERLLWGHQDPMPHHLGADQLASPGIGPVLIVRSGPLFVFNDLVDWVSAAVPDVTLLLQENVAVASRHAHLPVLRVPAGMFDPHKAFPDRTRLLTAGFATVLYPVTDFTFLDTLSNFLLFFAAAPSHRAYAYLMRQILRAPRRKTLLPIDPEPSKDRCDR